MLGNKMKTHTMKEMHRGRKKTRVNDSIENSAIQIILFGQKIAKISASHLIRISTTQCKCVNIIPD